MNQTWCLSIELPSEHSDIAVAVCIQHGMLGCEEQQNADHLLFTFHFGSREEALGALDRLTKQLTVYSSDISAVEQQDWNAKWRESMEPARLTGSIWVSPVWLPPSGAPDDLWIKIEPKMAFGTGHHETTRLAAHAITTVPALSGARLLDIGTGSGVLSFAAAFRGAHLSVGVEIDPVCLENIAENRESNKTPGSTAFIVGTTDALAEKPFFDIIVMNMIRTHSEPLLQTCRTLLKPGGTLIWSGILIEEAEDVIESARGKGFSLQHQNNENEWWCGVFNPQMIADQTRRDA